MAATIANLVTATVECGSPTPRADQSEWQRSAHGYTVTLHCEGRSMVVPFYMGSGWTKDPTAADVVSCLLSDACTVENCADEIELAEEYGYDNWRSARRIWRAMVRQTADLRDLLGSHFESAVWPDHETYEDGHEGWAEVHCAS